MLLYNLFGDSLLNVLIDSERNIMLDSLTAPTTEWQQRAEEYFLKGNYSRAASIFEQAIAADPDVKLYYWYLGLTLLLQGQECEAQTTWFMAMVEGEPEQVNIWNSELVTILHTEAERQEGLEEYSLAESIRQNIREIAPENIDNLLRLLRLLIKLGINTLTDLEDLGIIKILKSDNQPEINLELLIETIRDLLNKVILEPTILDFVDICLPYFENHKEALLTVLVPSCVKIAYSRKIPSAAAQLAEIYLKLSPNNAEVIGLLASFYQNSHEYKKGIDNARLFYSLVERLPDKLYANRQILRGLIGAGGHWSEIYPAYENHQSLLKMFIAENPTELDSSRVSRLFASNYFDPYIRDNPRENRNIQNQILRICQTNVNNYAQETLDKHIQGHSQRKKQNIPGRKIKIGYVSHCLRSHSVGWLARWLIQHLDREKFVVNAYFLSTNPPYDPLHDWYVNIVDKAFKSDEPSEITKNIYADEIDILIDLDSLTLDLTCEVLALKPAPIQATWLGWDASGIPSIDYFIADPYVLPESAEEYYTEQIWRLPQTFIAVDGFELGVPTLNRSELDIPSDAIVYLCTQRGLKRHPDITRLQLKIIKEVENSYLLFKGAAEEDSSKHFINQIAEEESIDISKVRFLPDSLTEAIHRANLGIADIILDTYPYSGATTTLETLWMCIPLVTKVGQQFSARNSYALMMNAGITEGIAWTDEEYVEWGVRLGKDEALRQKVAWKLKKSRETSPLWNGKQFTREMENAYQQMWQIYMES